MSQREELAGVIWAALWERKQALTMDTVRQDVRYALRTLARSPGFTLAAILLLGSGIGGSTALFSLLEETLLAPPPYPQAERLVVVDNMFNAPGEAASVSTWSYPRFEALRSEMETVRDLAGYGLMTGTVTERGDAFLASVEAVTPAYFRLLGIEPIRGRAFGVDQEDDGAPALVALVGHRFWQTRLGSDPGVVGATVMLDRVPVRVLGVLPEGFDGLTGYAELWIPLSALRVFEDPSALEDPWNQHFNVVGRLGDGVPLERARAEARAFGATVMDRFPPPTAASRLEYSADVTPYLEARVNHLARASMLALFGAVSLMLLAAAANLAALLLARAAARRHETAVRVSIGAGRGRLVRQLLTESLVLAVIGGAVGVAVAAIGLDTLGVWLTGAVGTVGGRGLQYLDPDRLTVDLTALAFATLLTAGIGVLCGLLPAWHAARTEPGAVLRSGRAGASGQALGHRIGARHVLIGLQVGLALVLVTGASLTARSLAQLQAVQLGYEHDGLLTATYTLTPADEAADVNPGAFHSAFLDRVRGLPGVADATLGEVPMGGPTYRTIVMGSEGRPDLVPEMHTWIRLQPVADGYLRVLGASMVAGRTITSTDDEDTQRVVVLNQTAAEALFPEGGAIGRRIQLPLDGFMEPGALVVGVVADLALGPPDGAAELQGFVAIRQNPRLGAGLIVRVGNERAGVLPAIRSTLSELNPNVALTSAMSQTERLSGTTARPRVISMLFGVFASVALFLVAVGLYGVIAFTVVRRTRELGVRASLGANRRSLLTLIVVPGLVVTIVGIVLGLVGALWLTPLLRSLLFQIEPLDPFAFASAAGALLIVALAALYLPARRATRIDPVSALRVD